jgi:hypothetical protein
LIDTETYDYEYFSKDISFGLSQICLEGPPLKFWEDLLGSILSTIESLSFEAIHNFFGMEVPEWAIKPKKPPSAKGAFLEKCKHD